VFTAHVLWAEIAAFRIFNVGPSPQNVLGKFMRVTRRSELLVKKPSKIHTEEGNRCRWEHTHPPSAHTHPCKRKNPVRLDPRFNLPPSLLLCVLEGGCVISSFASLFYCFCGMRGVVGSSSVPMQSRGGAGKRTSLPVCGVTWHRHHGRKRLQPTRKASLSTHTRARERERQV